MLRPWALYAGAMTGIGVLFFAGACNQVQLHEVIDSHIVPAEYRAVRLAEPDTAGTVNGQTVMFWTEDGGSLPDARDIEDLAVYRPSDGAFVLRPASERVGLPLDMQSTVVKVVLENARGIQYEFSLTGEGVSGGGITTQNGFYETPDTLDPDNYIRYMLRDPADPAAVIIKFMPVEEGQLKNLTLQFIAPPGRAPPRDAALSIVCESFVTAGVYAASRTIDVAVSASAGSASGTAFAPRTFFYRTLDDAFKLEPASVDAVYGSTADNPDIITILKDLVIGGPEGEKAVELPRKKHIQLIGRKITAAEQAAGRGPITIGGPGTASTAVPGLYPVISLPVVTPAAEAGSLTLGGGDGPDNAIIIGGDIYVGSSSFRLAGCAGVRGGKYVYLDKTGLATKVQTITLVDGLFLPQTLTSYAMIWPGRYPAPLPAEQTATTEVKVLADVPGGAAMVAQSALSFRVKPDEQGNSWGVDNDGKLQQLHNVDIGIGQGGISFSAGPPVVTAGGVFSATVSFNVDITGAVWQAKLNGMGTAVDFEENPAGTGGVLSVPIPVTARSMQTVTFIVRTANGGWISGNYYPTVLPVTIAGWDPVNTVAVLSHNGTHTGYTNMAAALAAANAGGGHTVSDPAVITVTQSAPMPTSPTINTGKGVVLTAVPGVSLTNVHLTVNSGAYLMVRGPIVLRGTTSTTNSIINTSGVLRLENGATLSGNGSLSPGTHPTNGGAVLVSGTFNMEGGLITGNYAQFGGGVSIAMGGVMTMTGGIIENNTATHHGGGVNANGMFKLYGGVIRNNQVSSEIDGWGGGVAVRAHSGDAVFHMLGGTISSNSAFSNAAGAVYGGGGGVAVVAHEHSTSISAKFIMAGGVITGDNSAQTGRETLYLLSEGPNGSVFAKYGPDTGGGADIITVPPLPDAYVGLSGPLFGHDTP